MRLRPLLFRHPPHLESCIGTSILRGGAEDKAAHDEGQYGHDARYGGRGGRNGANHQGRAAPDHRGKGKSPAAVCSYYYGR